MVKFYFKHLTWWSPVYPMYCFVIKSCDLFWNCNKSQKPTWPLVMTLLPREIVWNDSVITSQTQRPSF